MGFRNPEALWLAALAVPLVVLYILKVRREEERVPSTLLWDAAMREVAAQVPFRRLRRDWLLLLQLLILIAATLAAAAPFRRTMLPPGERVAVVLDASASMLAGDRADSARGRARALVDSRGAGDAVLLVRAGVEPQVITPLGDDRVALKSGIADWRPDPAPADLGAALALARSVLGGEGSVVLVTDGLSAYPADAVDRVENVGAPADNVGIVALGVRPANPSGADHQVFVRVRNGAVEARSGRVEVQVDGRTRDAAQLTVQPGGEVGKTLRLVGIPTGRVRVAWVGEQRDALAADDAAEWVLSERRARSYRIHGQADLFLRHALAAIEGWQEAPSGVAAELDIFVREAPTAGGPPYVWIDPLALRESVLPGAGVLSWDRTHPMLRYVNLNAVRFGRIARLRRPAGARVLAESTAGPLILEGGAAGRRGVIWGFDPLQSDFPLAVSFPVLVQNTLEHLVPADRHLDGGVASGSAPSLPWSATEARLVAPSGAERTIAPSAGMLHLPPLTELGVWTVTGGQEQRSFAVSLLDAAETDLRATAAAADGTAAAGGSTAGQVSDERPGLLDLWRPFVLAALACLLLEGAAFHRRWEP